LDLATIVVARNLTHKGEQKQTVVVGALGVIGRYIVERLVRQKDWCATSAGKAAQHIITATVSDEV